jgi:serine/threonine-protein kinase RsbW
VEANGDAAVVELRIPAKPEYVGVARLAILGVASRMRFSYDEVEDIRLAVGEACTTAVEWAAKNGKQDTDVIVRSSIAESTLTVNIIDQAGQREEPEEQANRDPDPESLGALLITLLVDEVNVSAQDGGTCVTMIKNAG